MAALDQPHWKESILFQTDSCEGAVHDALVYRMRMHGLQGLSILEVYLVDSVTDSTSYEDFMGDFQGPAFEAFKNSHTGEYVSRNGSSMCRCWLLKSLSLCSRQIRT